MKQYWRDGAPTEACIEAFTEGDCWVLAIHLHRMTGWPIYLVDAGDHWVVRETGQDRYLDVTGVYTRSQLLRRWEATSLSRIDEQLLEYAESDTSPESPMEAFEGSQRRAPVVARRLLMRHGVKA